MRVLSEAGVLEVEGVEGVHLRIIMKASHYWRRWCRFFLIRQRNIILKISFSYMADKDRGTKQGAVVYNENVG